MRDIKIFMIHGLQRLMFELSDGTTSLVVRPPIARAETSEKISFFSDHPVFIGTEPTGSESNGFPRYGLLPLVGRSECDPTITVARTDRCGNTRTHRPNFGDLTVDAQDGHDDTYRLTRIKYQTRWPTERDRRRNDYQLSQNIVPSYYLGQRQRDIRSDSTLYSHRRTPNVT